MKRVFSLSRRYKVVISLAIVFLVGFIMMTKASAQINPTHPIPPSALDSTLDSPNPFEHGEFLNMHQQMRVFFFLTVLSLIPFFLVMMTSFTRISVVLHFLRQALATQQVPSTQVIIGMSLILTGFVMHPVITEIQEKALTPYFSGTLRDEPEVRLGIKGEDTLMMERTWKPLRNFMLRHTRERDMSLFLEMGKVNLPLVDTDPYGNPTDDEQGSVYDLSEIPWFCLVPAFVISELRTAFMMGFLLFIPFLVIDMVVASILMSMGMMMLPPVMLSMPFKLLLFIVIDGWRLVLQQMVNGFFTL